MGNAAKKTTEMTPKERKALQTKLDAMLAQAIADVHELGYETYDIMEHVRITNNRSRLGSASCKNDARLSRRWKKMGREVWEGSPLFQISISTRECATDSDIKDTLYHEVIHCIPGCFNHGTDFKVVAALVNAKFGTHVDTRKRESESESGNRAENTSAAKSDTQMKIELLKHFGKTFKRGRKTYTFVGLNDRPKNCCVLADANGTQYVCNVRTCAHYLGID